MIRRVMELTDVDQLLWNMVVLDDEKAFEQLFVLFYAPLLYHSRRYINDQPACEDIVQEVFVGIWENRKTLHVTSSLRNYLLITVRNHCLNYLKREDFARQYRESVIEKQSPGTENGDEDFFLLNELYELLNQTLAKLPEPYRRVFEMRRMEGKSYETIAEELHISARTAKRYKKHVVDRLKKELKDYLPAMQLLLIVFLENCEHG